MLRIKLYKLHSCMELLKRKEKGLKGLEKILNLFKPFGPLGQSLKQHDIKRCSF